MASENHAVFYKLGAAAKTTGGGGGRAETPTSCRQARRVGVPMVTCRLCPVTADHAGKDSVTTVEN